MNDFWNGKSLQEVTKEYLCASADDLIDAQPINIDGIVQYLCENITIRNNAKGFVADYFNDAVLAMREFNGNNICKITEYDKVANMMLTMAAKEVLEQCDTAQRYEGSYHIWKKSDVEDLKDDLNDMVFEHNFKRAADTQFESLDGYSYRFLEHVLKGLDGQTVNLKNLIWELPLVKLSEKDAMGFIKGNFDEAMRLLDDFKNSGYKVDYTNPESMAQCILFQQQKEILKDNPYLEDLIVYDGMTEMKVDQDFIEELTDSLHEQKNNVKLSKFEEMAHNIKERIVPSKDGKVIDLSRKPARIEVLC